MARRIDQLWIDGEQRQAEEERSFEEGMEDESERERERECECERGSERVRRLSQLETRKAVSLEGLHTGVILRTVHKRKRGTVSVRRSRSRFRARLVEVEERGSFFFRPFGNTPQSVPTRHKND